MFKRIAVVFATTALALPALAGVASASSESASQNGCFGQARSSSVQLLTDAGFVVGREFFSQRKGDNADMNVTDKSCQSV